MTKETLIELFDKSKNLVYFLLQFSRIKGVEFSITISPKTGIRFHATEQSDIKRYHYEISQIGDVVKYQEISTPNIKH